MSQINTPVHYNEWHVYLHQAWSFIIDGNFDQARTCASNLYKSAEFHKNDDIALTIYNECLKLSEKCQDNCLSIKCLYRVKFLRCIQIDITVLWIRIIYGVELNLQSQLALIRELWDIIEEYEQDRHPLTWICIEELSISYKYLLHRHDPRKHQFEIIRRECLQHDIKRAKMYYKIGNYDMVCAICKALYRIYSDYQDIFLVLEIWVYALEKLNKIDIAVKKAVEALTLNQMMHDTSLLKERYNHLLIQMNMKLNEVPSHLPDREWLEGTSAALFRQAWGQNHQQISSPRKRRSRPSWRHREYDEESLPEIEIEDGTADSIYQTDEEVDTKLIECHGPKSWKDITEFDIPIIRGSKRRRKRRLKCNNENFNFNRNESKSQNNLQFSAQESFDDILESMKVVESSDSDNDFVSVSSHSDISDSDTVSVESFCTADETDDTEYDEERNDTFFNESCKYWADNMRGRQYKDNKYSIPEYLDETVRFDGIENHWSTKANTRYTDFFTESKAMELLNKYPDEFKICVIEIEGAHNATCINQNPNDTVKRIKISGRSKCGKSFTDDEVVVQILNTQKKYQLVNEENRTVYGRVVCIIKRKRHPYVEHPVFLCTLDEYQMYFMKPVCKTVPKLYIPNRRCKQAFEIELYSYDDNKKEMRFSKIKTINPAHRKDYIFLVCFVSWNGLYPLGVAFDVYTPNDKSNYRFKLHCHQFQIPILYKEKTVQGVRKILEDTKYKEDSRTREDLTESLDVFTIDPRHARDLDDALSIREEEPCVYEVGVHIADVASVVKPNTEIDKEARDRFQSFYPGDRYRPHHMLPEPLSTGICSLLPNEQRKTISVFFKIDKSGKILCKPIIKRTIIKSIRQFSYEEVGQTLGGDNEESDSLSDDIRLLVDISKALRRRRINNKAFWFRYDDVFEGLDSLSSVRDVHQMIEEYMILTNHFVAEYLFKSFQHELPLRVQKPPSEENVKKWLKSHGSTGHIVMAVQDLRLNNILISLHNIIQDSDHISVHIQKHIWKRITDALQNNRLDIARKLIGCDEMHPEQALALKTWFSIQCMSEYKCSGDLITPAERNHYSLELNMYVQFTSPLRRYLDLTIHRMVHAALDQTECPYSSDEIRLLCRSANAANARSNDFELLCRISENGQKLRGQPHIYFGIVQGISEDDITISFPGNNDIGIRNSKIPFRMLGVSVKPTINKSNSKSVCTLQWQQRLYSKTGYGYKSRRQQHLVTKLDPHQRVIFNIFHEWATLLQNVVDGTDEDLSKAIQHLEKVSPSTIPVCTETEKDVSSEVRDGEIAKQCCDFSMTFSPGQVCAVQFSTLPERGILVPTMQVLDLTRNVRFCLQHVADPVKTFAQYATFRFNENVRTIARYVDCWLSIYNMESVVNMVDDMTLMINDLPVKFKKSLKDDGYFILQKSFCEKRDIEFNCISPALILEGEEKGHADVQDFLSRDCICIKCDLVHSLPPGSTVRSDCLPNKRSIWVGHGEIVSLKRSKKHVSDEKYKIQFRLHKESARPTPDMILNSNKSKMNCSVQILQKAETDQRVEVTLKCLNESTDLAKSIAMGKKKFPAIDSNHIQILRKVSTDVIIGDYLPRNNKEQSEAIEKCLRSSFSMIQGPPGTGKTFTGIKLTYLFAKINYELNKNGSNHKQVVFCGPSNKSVDLVARWMFQRLPKADGFWRPTFVRMYGSSLECTIYKIPGRDYSARKTCKDNRPDSEIWDISLHNLIRKDDKPFASKLKEFDKMFKDNPYSPDYEKIQEYQALLSKATQEELKHYDVIFCTTAVATNPKFLMATRKRLYQLIIDEAGMCTEPETMAPIIATHAKQVVLIGDHKQLQPIVKCKEAASLGLQKSLFERLSSHAVMLKKQYRMNPEICRFPSDNFYNGKLETMESYVWNVKRDLKIWRNPKYPFVFCHVEGEEESLTVSTEDGNLQSKSNLLEVKHVVRIFSHLMKQEGLETKDVNVISQYNAQCSAIRSALRERLFINFKVNTVVSSQGGEWDYVIFSTVRSLPEYRIETNPTPGWRTQNLGFITDEHQINVALTRARKGIIIIGNKNLMTCDPMWKKLLARYEEHKCVVNAEDFPTRHRRL